jgi:hypothetical protein
MATEVVLFSSEEVVITQHLLPGPCGAPSPAYEIVNRIARTVSFLHGEPAEFVENQVWFWQTQTPTNEEVKEFLLSASAVAAQPFCFH